MKTCNCVQQYTSVLYKCIICIMYYNVLSYRCYALSLYTSVIIIIQYIFINKYININLNTVNDRIVFRI